MFFDAGYHSNIKKSKHQDSSFSQGLRKPEGKLQSHKNKVALRLLLRVVSCLIYANANVFSSEIFKNGRLLQLRIRRWQRVISDKHLWCCGVVATGVGAVL